MADRAISDLTVATAINEADLFVLQQSNVAKAVTGSTLESWLLTLADGHGGIASIENIGTIGLVDTYRITLADNTQYDFTVTNGNGISTITWETSGTSGDGQVHTGTIHYTNNTTSNFTVRDGVKGDTGSQTYVYIRYSSASPTQDSDMYTTPDNWMGVYVGLESDPTNLHYTNYAWFNIKGSKGDTGDASAVTSNSVQYQASNSGTVIPSGSWSDNPPALNHGDYLWTRVQVQFNSGDTTTFYSVGYIGMDGTGQGDMVKSVYDNDSSVAAVGGIAPYVTAQLPQPTLSDPLMDGIAASGSQTTYARSDHRHPSDTAKASAVMDGDGVSVASGDKIVVVDSSDSNKVVKSTVSFDGSTTTKALTPKGTFETFLQSHQSLSAYAPLDSPELTGTPTAPTATAGTNTTQIATTAFVKTAVTDEKPMHFSESVTSLTSAKIISDARITASHRVVDLKFVGANTTFTVAWSTADGSVTFTLSSGTFSSCTFDFILELTQ